MPQPGTNGQRNRSSSSTRKHENDANPDLSLTGIGNYVFERTIGQGNFAKVKLAKHKLTEQEVAIKIIDKTTLDEKKLSKLHREVRIMKMLNHPNIVKLFEVIETKYTLFLVMEYVSGGELYDYLVAHGRMKEKDARAKFRQILSAVHYCHKKRVIHRDLKAENLLMDSNMNVKIADFGFSNHYAPDGQLDTFCGSPPYAAPELFQGRKYTGPEVDVWSLGVILYVLSTGCLPFDGKDLKEMREVVCRGRYKVPFYLSDGCEKLLRKFLVRDPTKRSSLDILKDDVWLNEGYPDQIISDFVPPDLSKSIEEDIVHFITEKFNIPKQNIVTALQDNTYDDIAAIYMLLLDQKQSGKWAPTQTGLSPLTPVNLQSGTTNPISKPTPMGTIGEEADGQQQPIISQDSPDRMTPQAPERRDRSHTTSGTAGASNRQRPVTWVGNDSQVQRFLDDIQKNSLQQGVPAPGSGPKLESGAVLGAEQLNGAGALNGSPVGSTTAATGAPNGSVRTTTSAATPTPAGHQRHQTAPPTQFSPPEQQQQQQSQQQQRGGVIGAIKNFSRRLSESTAGAAAAHAAAQEAAAANGGPGDEKPRSLRFTFNSNTTSGKAPQDLVKEIVNACHKHGVKWQMNGKFLVECSWNLRDAPIQKTNTNGSGGGGGGNNPEPAGNMDTEQLQRALQEVMNGSMGSLNKAAGGGVNGKEGGQGNSEKDLKDIVKFDVEICELPRLKNLHGLRFRRAAGQANDYKDICGKILASLNL